MMMLFLCADVLNQACFTLNAAGWFQILHDSSCHNFAVIVNTRMSGWCKCSSKVLFPPKNVLEYYFQHFVWILLATVGADQLWEGVVAVSNAGRKRGRGKRVGRKKITDLNRGQMLGTGTSFCLMSVFVVCCFVFEITNLTGSLFLCVHPIYIWAIPCNYGHGSKK